jgi:hypothetical protein
MLQLFEDFWQKWSNRLVVTLSIIAFLDYWRRFRRQNDHPDTSKPVSPEIQLNAATEQNQRQSRLLDELEEKEGYKKRKKGDTEALEKRAEVSTEREFEHPAKPIESKRQPSKISKATSNTKLDHNTASKSTDLPPIQATSNEHPGMEGFNHWQEVETSLFRIYTLGRKDGVQVVPPYVPHSYRGTVPIFLDVTNTTNIPMKVFWVNFQGQAIFKGDLKPDRTWTQTTWIDQ